MNEEKTVTDEKPTDATPQPGTSLEVNDPRDEKPEDPKEKAGMYLSQKDYSWLRKTNYEEERRKYNTTFVLQHRKFPTKIVELKGATAVHACGFIHWKPQQVRLLEMRKDVPKGTGNEAVDVGVVKPTQPVMAGATAIV
jgi:hypothetical protein